MSNLTINVTTPDSAARPAEFWAVSQAAPMRRVQINGGTTADGLLHRRPVSSPAAGSSPTRGSRRHVINGSQQQFLVRNCTLDGWTNGVWNQVFAGDRRRAGAVLPRADRCGGPYTTLATTPV